MDCKVQSNAVTAHGKWTAMFICGWGPQATRAAANNAASWMRGIFGRVVRVPTHAPSAKAPPSFFMLDSGWHRASLTTDGWFDLCEIIARCAFGRVRCKRIKESVIRVNPESCF